MKEFYNLSERAVNLVYYLCGSNLRTIDQVVSQMKGTHVGCTSTEIRIKERCDTNSPWDHRANITISKDRALIDALLDKMVEVNYRIVKHAAQNPGQLPAINWIEEVKPLNHAVLLSVCTKVGIDMPEYAVSLLIDKGYFSGSPHLSYLLPNKPSQLVDYFPHYKTPFVKSVTALFPIASKFFSTAF